MDWAPRDGTIAERYLLGRKHGNHRPNIVLNYASMIP